MNKAISLCLIPLALTPSVYGLINLGEGRIDLETSASVFYDSEIRARNLGQDDMVLTIRPSLVYTRPSKSLDLMASVSLRGVVYADHDEYNDLDVYFDLGLTPTARMETARFRVNGDVILNSESRADADVGDIVTIRTYGASGQVIYDPNRRFNIIGRLSARREDPDSERLYTIDRYNASGTVQTPLNEDISLQATAGYSKIASEGRSTDSEIFTYSAGFVGDLFTKLRADVSAGIQDTKYENGQDDSSPYISASLNWQANETSSISCRVAQSIGTTLDDRATDTFSVDVTGRRELNRQFAGSVFLGYDDIDYNSLVDPLLDRSDQEYYFGGSLSYDWVRWSSIRLEARYSDRSSTDPIFSYDRLRVGVVMTGTW